MNLRNITLVFSLLFVFACNKDKAKENTKAEAPKIPVTENVDKRYKVKLDFIAKKDDSFSLFYTEDGSIDFTKIEPIWVEFKGNPEMQEIVFNIPDKVVPTQIRLDFGVNKDQSEVVIRSLKMEHAGKYFEAQGNLFFEYFRPDPTKTIIDKETAVVKAVVKDGVRQSPSFYPIEDVMKAELAKLK